VSGRLRRLLLLARIDARRPAAWLALVVAAGVAALLPDAVPAGWPAPAVVATLLGAAVAVMALGDAVQLGGASGIDGGWLAERIAWPLLGWGGAAALRENWPLFACGGVGIMAAAILVAMLVHRGALAADAASAVLVTAGVSGAAGWWFDAEWPGRFPAGAVAAGILAIVVMGAKISVSGCPVPALRAGLRRLLTAAGMTGALTGMVAWLFLAADRAPLDLAASLAWFVALAVPAATLGDGVSHAVVWRRLERAAPRGAGGRPRLPPGRTRDGVMAALGHAALLGWPPLVAAVISGASLTRAWPAASVVLALAAAAGVLVVVVWLGERAASSPATVQAAAVACACLAVAGTMAIVAGSPGNSAVFSGFPLVTGPNCR